MPLFTPANLSAIRTKAEQALSTLGQKGSSDLVLYGDTTIFNDLHIIYDLYELSKWMESVGKTDEEIGSINSYLLHKIEGYIIGTKVQIYSGVSIVRGADAGSIIPGGLLPFVQFVVGSTIDPDTMSVYMADAQTSFTDPDLIGEGVEVYVDSLQLSVGLSDRLSYTFNPLTGQVLFSTNLYAPSVVRIFKYSTSLGAGTETPVLPAPVLTATVISDSQINLGWAAVLGATGYVVDRSLDNLAWTNIYAGPLTSFSDTGRAESTLFYYRIKATGAGYTDSAYGTASGTTSAAAFNPANTPDLLAWYDFSDPATMTLSSGTTIETVTPKYGTQTGWILDAPEDGGGAYKPLLAGTAPFQYMDMFSKNASIYHILSSPRNGNYSIYMLTKLKDKTSGNNTILAIDTNQDIFRQEGSPDNRVAFYADGGLRQSTPKSKKLHFGKWQVIRLSIVGNTATGTNVSNIENRFNKEPISGAYFNRVVDAPTTVQIEELALGSFVDQMEIADLVVLSNPIPTKQTDNNIVTHLMTKAAISRNVTVELWGDSHLAGPTADASPAQATLLDTYYSNKIIANNAVASTEITLFGDAKTKWLDENIEKPDWMVFQFGTNDSVRGMVNAGWKASYKAMLQDIITAGMPANKIILCTMPYYSAGVYFTNQAITVQYTTEIATELGLILCNLNADIQANGTPYNLSGDGVHADAANNLRFRNLLTGLIGA